MEIPAFVALKAAAYAQLLAGATASSSKLKKWYTWFSKSFTGVHGYTMGCITTENETGNNKNKFCLLGWGFKKVISFKIGFIKTHILVYIGSIAK